MKEIAIILLSFSIGLSLEATAQSPSSEIVLDRIAAVVNDGVVLESELDRQVRLVMNNLSAQNIQIPPMEVVRSQVLESLILKRIQLQRIERLGLSISDEELNRAMQRLAQQNNLTLSQLPEALARQGVDYAAYREELREQIALEQLRARDVNSRISVTRSEIDKLIASSAPDNVEYEVLHMLIATGADATEDEIAEARQTAEDLYQRLENGEDFGPLAIAYSNASEVLNNRGNLGYLKANALPSIFAEQVQTMSPGETAPPIKSPSGFHIVQLKDLRGMEKVMTEQRLARHILVMPSQIVSEEMAEQEINEIYARLQAGEDFAAIAEAESDDTMSASRGGELGWASPGNFVPQFEQVLGQLEKGEMSEPFLSPYGWHVVELMDIREHDATLEMRRQEAAAALRERKVQEESQLWMTELRDEAYVEIRIDENST